METVNFRDALIRAAKTFTQAFLTTVPALEVVSKISPEHVDITGIAALLIGGTIAGGSAVLSLVWNVLLDWSRSE